jgi:hypothetical protein
MYYGMPTNTLSRRRKPGDLTENKTRQLGIHHDTSKVFGKYLLQPGIINILFIVVSAYLEWKMNAKYFWISRN